MDLSREPVPPQAKPTDTIPDKVGYAEREMKWFLTLSAILGKQSDSRLWDLARIIQNRIRESLGGAAFLESPLRGTGLYLYPAETLHCSLLNFSTEDSPEKIDAALRDHVPLITRRHSLQAFATQAKWLYAYPKGECSNSFSLQLFLSEAVVRQLEQQFPGGNRKLYRTPVDGLVRGTINLARWLSNDKRELDRDQQVQAIDLFRQLDREFDQLQNSPGMINRLSVVKSDPWLSNLGPEQLVVDLPN